MKNEIWKDIKGYEGLYQISNLGRVKSLIKFHNTKNNVGYFSKEHILKPGIRNEYFMVCLVKNHKKKSISIHRLVAENFIKNPHNKKQVNHIDGNKLNNKADNLEWCTNQENIIHSWVNGLSKVTKRMRTHTKERQKPIIQYDRNMNLIKEWESASIAGEKLGIWQQGIVACLKRRTKTAGNYIWRYKEGEDGKNSNRKETNTND